jgi:hypothetical protein
MRKNHDRRVDGTAPDDDEVPGFVAGAWALSETDTERVRLALQVAWRGGFATGVNRERLRRALPFYPRLPVK